MDRILFPFVYLDSSTLLRSDVNPKILTRKAAKNSNKEFLLLLKKITLLSDRDDDYYKNICRLINNNIIDMFITCESINKIICESDLKKIFLFGKKTTNFDYAATKEWILWGEEISHSIFYEAAMTIADSQCVVIDERFISLDVGRTLMNYITSKCSAFLIGDKKYYNNIENINIIPMSPTEFIEELILQCD